MIHEIAIENFGSICSRITINLRVARNAPDLVRFRPSLSRPDVRLPTVAAFVGPNGSGKSTVLKAIIATLHFATNSSEIGPGAPISYFMPFLAGKHKSKPTRVEIIFDARWLSKDDDTLDIFRYELELGREENNLAASKVNYEALFHAPHGKWRRVFEHKIGSEVFLIREFGVGKSEKSIREAISSNRSVISVLARLFQNPLATGIWSDLVLLQTNFGTLSPNIQALSKYFVDYPDRFEQLNKDVRRIDVGISKLGIYQTPEGPSLYAEHHGLDSPVIFQSESIGTQHFTFLFPGISFALETGHIVVADEFDRDLHPELVIEIMSWFQSPERNPNNAQLLCTLHNTAVLESLEKEEVFLVEKSPDGVTDVWGAQDIKGLRRNLSLYRKYGQGALGAVPRIG